MPGPHALVSSLADCLVSGRNIALVMPVNIPWRSSFEGAVLHELQGRFGDSGLVLVGREDLEPYADVPGRFLLRHYASREDETSYRSAMGKSLAEHIVERDIFANNVVWLRDIPRDSQYAWLEFLGEFPRLLCDTVS